MSTIKQSKGEKPPSQLKESQSFIDSLDSFKFVPKSTKKTKRFPVKVAYEHSKNFDQSIEKNISSQKEEILNVNRKTKVGEKTKHEGKEAIKDYKEVLLAIKEYRDSHDAPVDTLGCHMLGDKSLNENELNFQKLIGILLSVQTKDEITHAAMKKFESEKLSIDDVIIISDEKLKSIIGTVNFSTKKVEYIKNAAKVIKEQYNYKVPEEYKDLVKIRGIGPKVANLFLQCAYGKTVGIAVDTHVHRISNRLGWVHTNTPEQTRISLETLLEQSYWEVVNGMLVGFGQTMCKPINPMCSSCPVQKLCPQGRSQVKEKKKIKSESDK